MIVAILLALPSCSCARASSRRRSDVARRALLRITAPLAGRASPGSSRASAASGRATSRSSTRGREPRAARRERASCASELAQLEQAAAHDVDARGAARAVKKRTPADTLGARVIGAPLSPQFRVLRLRIDRGEREVKPGMPVIAGAGPGRPHRQGLRRLRRRAARVDPSRRSTSWSRAPAARGMLKGLAPTRRAIACGIEYLLRKDEVADRRRGRDERPRRSFPPGLVSARSSRSTKSDDGMFQDAEVEPAVDVRASAPSDGAAGAAAARPTKAKRKSATTRAARAVAFVRDGDCSSGSSRTILCRARRLLAGARRPGSRSTRCPTSAL